VGSAIIEGPVSRHLLSFRKGTRSDVDLGATKSVLLVDNTINDIPL
jgi:hypothetical protein